MAVSYTEPIRTDLMAFLCQFASDRTPPVTLRCFVDGKFALSIESADGHGELLIPGSMSYAPLLEVLDQENQVPHFAVDGRATLQWAGVAGVEYYLVEESLASVWTARARVSDRGWLHYQWRTRFLEDAQTHQFRVTPVTAAGAAAGTPLAYSFAMVRVPDIPNVALSWAVGAVTVAAA